MYLTQKIKNNLKVVIFGLLLIAPFTLAMPAQKTQALEVQPNSLVAVNDAGGGGNGSGGGKNNSKKSQDPALSKKICTKDNCPIVSRYINPFITLLAGLVGLVAVIAIIIGGIEYSSAGGDPQKAANGKRHVRNAIVGLVAFVFFWAFMQWIIPGGIGQ